MGRRPCPALTIASWLGCQGLRSVRIAFYEGATARAGHGHRSTKTFVWHFFYGLSSVTTSLTVNPKLRTMKITKAIRKYLLGYAEPEAGVALAFGLRANHCLVIPSFAEGHDVLTTLGSIPQGPMGEVLTVLVVNEPEDAEPADIESNRRTMRAVSESFPLVRSVENLHWHRHPRGSLLTVDRTGERGIKKSHGVGLARKVGFDVALAVATTQEQPCCRLVARDRRGCLASERLFFVLAIF